MSKFIELIGRFRQMAAGQRARRIENVPGELVGIETGDDLGRLIPSELAALGVPVMRAVFAARYAEHRLFVYEQRGETEAGQGAIICCVDCSGSMGTPVAGTGLSGEAWAKGCALAMLDQARAARRDFAGILFSSAGEVKVFRFPAAQPARIADVLDFAEFFWGGGTNFEEPLGQAMDLLEAEFNDDGANARRHRPGHRRDLRRERGLDAGLERAQGGARVPAVRHPGRAGARSGAGGPGRQRARGDRLGRRRPGERHVPGDLRWQR